MLVLLSENRAEFRDTCIPTELLSFGSCNDQLTTKSWMACRAVENKIIIIKHLNDVIRT